ncbi:MAG TPA: GAF domain-containing protein, partial [Candidatus Baltobacteraceae bacterium]|nr:GAF domain-containing protein [Candidatus Baltobacteraceae bacterium]
YPVQKAVALPVLRSGRPLAILVVARVPAPDAGNIAYDLLSLLWAGVLMGLACAGVFARADALTLAFFGFCYFYATLDNTAWLRISPPLLTPWTALEASLSIWLGNIGFLYLCFRFPTGQPLERWRVADRAIVPSVSLVIIMYYLHFYQSAFSTGATSSLYLISSTIVVFWVLLGLAAYVARFWGASGPEVTRMRWVAAAIAVYAGAQVIFFIDQLLNRNATPWVTYLYNFNPAPFAFAYSLVRGRILDIRIVGGRAVIYALVTSIPVALLALADWFFARRLEDARLATVFEVGIAVVFSFWLRSLHKRIDRFAERIFFASRHRAFQRMHHIVEALPFTEKVATIESLLTEETASAMGFSSAALFRADDGRYVRTAETGWRDETQTLDADDPIVLFARSANRGVLLNEAPQSKAALPDGEAKPVYALPVVVGRRVIAVVLYGGHRDGEAIDAEEEQLFTGLAHAAATAYEHLHAIERERENAALRARLAELSPA